MVRTSKQKYKSKDKPDAAAPSGKANAAIKIRYYVDASECNHFGNWWLNLRDDKAKKAVNRRIALLKSGNFGDCKPLREGVWELRVDVGPGYRVYYAKDGMTVVLLLCGGDKRSQNRDIDRACAYWNDWKQREGEQ